MIIVSQNREVVIPFDSPLYIKKWNEYYLIITGENEEDPYGLGAYETREKAKEALKEIIDKYRHRVDVHYMPEE